MSISNHDPAGSAVVSIDKLILPSLDEPYNPTTRKLKTFEVKIDRSLTISRLKDYLADYGLPISGRNRGVLLERLRDFSKNPQLWTTQFRPARNPQRGSISNKRGAHSEVARLIEEQFGAAEQQTVHQPKRKGKARELHEPPALHPRVIDANTTWAEDALRELNNEGSASASRTRAEQTGDGGEDEPYAGLDDKGLISLQRVERRIVSLDHTIRGLESHLSTLRSISLGNPPRVSPSSTAPGVRIQGQSETIPEIPQLPQSHIASSTAFESLAPSSSDSSAGQPSGAPSYPAQTVTSIPIPPALNRLPDRSAITPQHAIPTEHLRFFELNGETFAFDKSQVPNPPGIAFSDDLSRLFREWHHSDLLVVNGRGIPIKHWPWFYKRKTDIKPEVWKVIRMKWGNWKFLVKERERFPTEEAFWAVYSENGTRFNMQRILDMLQGSRMSDSTQDAQAARKFFNKDLSDPRAHGYFLYKKTNVIRVMKQDATVARQWRKLLNDYPDIAEAWEDMQLEEEEAGGLGSA
ncbi:hypothetical protein C8Q76DRAFT_792075 [Earliella scabrosa]|nr:hypothetical protein C8Q76DRAFT_792075 [Earliella scabrosa]